jgi:hypothetical protein
MVMIADTYGGQPQKLMIRNVPAVIQDAPILTYADASPLQPAHDPNGTFTSASTGTTIPVRSPSLGQLLTVARPVSGVRISPIKEVPPAKSSGLTGQSTLFGGPGQSPVSSFPTGSGGPGDASAGAYSYDQLVNQTLGSIEKQPIPLWVWLLGIGVIVMMFID